MEDIMVSVYCLAYNHEKYIRNALDGFVTQKTNFRFEVFVHDDASTDNTANIIKEYADKYPDLIIPIFQTENQYRNGGKIVKRFIRHRMRGRYIAICEGDDFWIDSDKLQKQVDFLESHKDYVACVHNSNILNCSNGKTSLLSKITEDYTLEFKDVIKQGNCAFQLSSLVYRTEFFDNRPLCLQTKKFGDYSLSIHLVLSGKVYYMKEVMSTYRLMSSGSWTYNMYNHSDVDKIIAPYEEAIVMLKGVDEITGGKHTKLINDTIREKEYMIAVYKRDKNAIFSKYKDIFGQKPFTERVKIIIKLYFPKLETIYRKRRRRTHESKK